MLSQRRLSIRESYCCPGCFFSAVTKQLRDRITIIRSILISDIGLVWLSLAGFGGEGGLRHFMVFNTFGVSFSQGSLRFLPKCKKKAKKSYEIYLPEATANPLMLSRSYIRKAVHFERIEGFCWTMLAPAKPRLYALRGQTTPKD